MRSLCFSVRTTPFVIALVDSRFPVPRFALLQGRTACKEFWSAWVEPNSERLTRLARLKVSGKYPLIRLCKKLAQRMSKTHDSSLCGQVGVLPWFLSFSKWF